jgi:hypothetical protein
MAIAILALGDPATHLWAVLALMMAGCAALPWAERRLRHLPADRATAVAIVLAAAALRLPFLALPATLSDDTLRYVWDGRVVAAGFDPYRLAPEADELAALRDERWQRMPHRQVETVYPPVALAVFALAAKLPATPGGGPVAALKVLFTAADLLLCAILLALARHLRLPLARVVFYAWNPLVLTEIAGMGHVDALAVAAAGAAVWWVARGKPAAGGASAAFGVLAKLGPLVAIPLWARWSGRPWRFAGAALLLCALAMAPIAVGGVPPGLVTYGVSWEFNGPAYEPLWRAIDATGLATAMHRGLDRIKERSEDHEFWNRFYPYVYPQLLAKLLLAGGMLTVVAMSWRTASRRRAPPPGTPAPDARLITATGALFGGLLLLSATVYPWYLLWVLPWAALARQRAWLALSALLPLCYLAQPAAAVALWPWLFLVIWVPFFVLWVREPRWSIG